MAIDNPYDAIAGQYPEDEDGPIAGLAKFFGGAKELGFPMPPIAAQFFGFLNSKNAKARQERGLALIRQLVEDIQRIDRAVATMRTDVNEVQSAINMALEYDVNEFNDKKRDRYVSAITTAISSETKVNDLATFIQDIEKLGERDIIGLKILNRVMNKANDWTDPPPPTLNVPKLHPNTFLHRSADLAMAMAEALTGRNAGTLGNNFNREDGLQICFRLQGFGLAQFISGDNREVPISDYCARPTARGLMLLKLLGEQVPNWTRYFGPDGAL